MKYLVLGIENSVGEYAPANSEKSYPYNNYVLQCLNYETLANKFGYKVAAIKVKKPVLEKLLGGRSVDDLKFQVIDIFYNQYGGFEKVQFIGTVNVKLEAQNG